MPFPNSERVIYEINPLENVICQLRFPPILKIDSEIPAEFQEKIRIEFPIYNESIEEQGLIINESPIFSTQKTKNHEFSTEDGLWKINVTRTFIALSTSKYERWEQFNEKLNRILKTFVDIYKPPFFTRVGLRYIDVFDRAKLGLNNRSWEDLIKPYILGVLGTEISMNVDNFENTYQIKLSEANSTVRVITSLVLHRISREQCFKVDSDFFKSSRTNIEDTSKNLDFLNKTASKLIRWIITEELHNSLKPKKI
jgi:uncharacterized protein (TIGR04255 family)